MEKVIIVNPPLRLPLNFIDYPYFLNIFSVYAGSALKSKGIGVTVIESFSQPKSHYDIRGGEVFLGCSYQDLMNKIERSGVVSAIIITNSPFLDLHSPNQDMKSFIQTLQDNHPNTQILLADYCLGGMHYVDYDAEKICEEYGIDKVLQYDSLSLLDSQFDEILQSKQKVFQGTFKDINNIPLPNWDLLDTNEYFRFLREISEKDGLPFFTINGNTLPIYTSRGCLHNCSFCTSSLGGGDKYYPLDLDELSSYLDDIIRKYGIGKVVILDDLINPSKKRIADLLDLISSKNLKAEFPNGLRADQIPIDKIKRLKSVTRFLSVSLECADDNVRRTAVGKNVKVSDIEKLAQTCQKHEIPFGVHYMIGIPGEDVSSINITLHTAYDLYQKYNAVPFIQYALPLPSTKMGKICEEKGLIETKEDITEIDLSSALMKESIVKTDEFKPDDLRKIKENFETRIESKDKKKIIVNLTYSCNNNCVFCAVGDRPRKDGNWEEQIDYIKKSRDNGIRFIDIDGGEPTLHKKLLTLIGLCDEFGYERIAVTTNGRLLANKKMAIKFMESPISEIIFSIHGSKPEIHERITRAPGSYKQTMEGLSNCIEINRKLKEKKKDISVNTTICKQNITDLPAIQKRITSKGIKKWTIHYPTPFGSANAKFLPDDATTEKNLEKVIANKPKDLNLKIINLPFCKLPKAKEYLNQDIQKNQREMMFCDGTCVELYEYLAEKRNKDKECNNCIQSIICGGEMEMVGYKLVYSNEKDILYDYCRTKYDPLEQVKGKYKSINLLLDSIRQMDHLADFFPLIKETQRRVGKGNSIWGVKKIGKKLFWEFYFYNREKKDPKMTFENVIPIYGEMLDLKILPKETIPYFMFSIDITHETFTKGKKGGIHIYVNDQRDRANTSTSYIYLKDKLKLENHYAFYDPKTEPQDLVRKIKDSANVDYSITNLNKVLLPELYECKRICSARKATCDSIYYSGLDIYQFLSFLKEFKYPNETLSFVRKNENKFNHLQYDVGFDYVGAGPSIRVIKSGYYGTF